MPHRIQRHQRQLTSFSRHDVTDVDFITFLVFVQLEVLHAVLNNPHEARDRSFFYFRNHPQQFLNEKQRAVGGVTCMH